MKRQVGIHSVLKHAVLWICSLSCLIPFLLLIISSFTDDSTIALRGYSFFPKAWSLDAYRYLLGQGGKILHAYGISLFVTVFGTLAGLAMTLMLAYPLSRPDLPGRRVFSFYVLFTQLYHVDYHLPYKEHHMGIGDSQFDGKGIFCDYGPLLF